MIYMILFSILSFNFVDCNETVRHSPQPPIPLEFFNTELDEQNPSSFWPPRTDAGAQSPFKYPFSFARADRSGPGWFRIVSQRDLPIATGMAGVQRKLPRNAIREMHWHLVSEWSYLIYGQLRITCVGPGGLAFVDDIEAGDVWLFPAGWAHSLQAIGETDAFYLAVLPAGNIVDSPLILLTDLMNHTPREVLAKNFQTSESTFANIPIRTPLGSFPGVMPGPLKEDIMQVSMGTGLVEQWLAFHSRRMPLNVTRTGGTAQVIDRNNFPVTDIAAAIVTIRPGGMREIHWHTNADEWQYYVRGKARMTVFIGNGMARTMDFTAGDVGYVPQTIPHYIENTCDEDVLLLEVFPTPYYQDISLADWLAHTPSLLVDQHIRTGERFINRINRTEATLVPW